MDAGPACSAPDRRDRGKTVAAGEAGQVADVDGVPTIGASSRALTSRASRFTRTTRPGAGSPIQFLAQTLEREAVAFEALPSVPRQAQVADHRQPPPRVAGLDVGQMHFHGRKRSSPAHRGSPRCTSSTAPGLRITPSSWPGSVCRRRRIEARRWSGRSSQVELERTPANRPGGSRSVSVSCRSARGRAGRACRG